jgi:L-asparagine transporter-like permease
MDTLFRIVLSVAPFLLLAAILALSLSKLTRMRQRDRVARPSAKSFAVRVLIIATLFLAVALLLGIQQNWSMATWLGVVLAFVVIPLFIVVGYSRALRR